MLLIEHGGRQLTHRLEEGAEELLQSQILISDQERLAIVAAFERVFDGVRQRRGADEIDSARRGEYRQSPQPALRVPHIGFEHSLQARYRADHEWSVDADHPEAVAHERAHPLMGGLTG